MTSSPEIEIVADLHGRKVARIEVLAREDRRIGAATRKLEFPARRPQP